MRTCSKVKNIANSLDIRCQILDFRSFPHCHLWTEPGFIVSTRGDWGTMTVVTAIDREHVVDRAIDVKCDAFPVDSASNNAPQGAPQGAPHYPRDSSIVQIRVREKAVVDYTAKEPTKSTFQSAPSGIKFPWCGDKLH